MKTALRLISDVHGKTSEYIQLASAVDYSIQLGDMGRYDFVEKLDPNRHKFFAGNHDNYDIIDKIPHNMGRYGIFELNGVRGFFIRGAHSVDKNYRLRDWVYLGHKSWWEEEELTYKELCHAIDMYKSIKPDLMLTHTFPDSWCKKFGSNKILNYFGYTKENYRTVTCCALDACFEYHKPKLWHGAHFHFNKDKVWHTTRFICRRELGYTDLDENLNVIGDYND